ncbi:MAG: nicotinate phosphoribosyltransferase, partial [Bacteroidota bacterium]
MKHFKHKGLYTDFYELTMAQGYFLQNKHYQEATFDYFFRKNPFDGGYVVFAGLWELLRELKHFRYGQKELEFLKQQGFHDDFLSYLEDFRFRGDIISCREGEIIFPLEPVMQVTGNIIETQLVESMLLNILNFSSLIATKAIRIRQEAKDRIFVDFGLRRAQGFGSLLAARAAAIGG